jgi:hypothetical protein
MRVLVLVACLVIAVILLAMALDEPCPRGQHRQALPVGKVIITRCIDN